MFFSLYHSKTPFFPSPFANLFLSVAYPVLRKSVKILLHSGLQITYQPPVFLFFVFFCGFIFDFRNPSIAAPGLDYPVEEGISEIVATTSGTDLEIGTKLELAQHQHLLLQPGVGVVLKLERQ